MKKLKSLVYGNGIYSAIQKDDILKQAQEPSGVLVVLNHPLDEENKDYWKKICYLSQNGFLAQTSSNVYHITETGRHFLAIGGYEGEVKKEMISIRAFHISIVAVIIALVSLLANIFGWFSLS